MDLNPDMKCIFADFVGHFNQLIWSIQWDIYRSNLHCILGVERLNHAQAGKSKCWRTGLHDCKRTLVVMAALNVWITTTELSDYMDMTREFNGTVAVALIKGTLYLSDTLP